MFWDKGQIAIALSVLLIAFSFAYRKNRNIRKFRWLLLGGLIGLAGGVTHSISVWAGLAFLGIWFVIAFYFCLEERKERVKNPSKVP